MSRQNIATDAVTRRVSLKDLYLDPNNYRLIHELEQTEVKDENVKDQDVARRTFRLLIGEKNQYIQDLLDSFRTNGYLPVDQIQVRELSDGGYVVVEGNRRVAALRYLEQEYEKKGIDLGRLDSEIFNSVPVVLYNDADEVHHLTIMALKHISGNRKWGEWNQAKLLEKMHSSYKLAEDDICKRVGITKIELRRSLRALALVSQYQASDYGDQFNESKFPIFREAVRSQAVKAWLGWDEGENKANNTNNCEIFFSLLSKEPMDEDDDGYLGYNNGYRDPAINKRDDIRSFGKILSDQRSLDKLIETRDFLTANDVYNSSNARISELRNEKVDALSEEVQSLLKFNLQVEQLPSLENSLGGLHTVVNRLRANSNGLLGVEGNDLFRDQVDQHLSLLYIKSYKKFKNFELKGLSKINFFAGLNNSGKTTLLEAVYLLMRQNDFKGVLNVIRRRGKVPEDQLNIQWLKNRLFDDVEISGIFDSENTRVQIRNYSDIALPDKASYVKSVEITANFGVNDQESLTHLYQDRRRETIADSLKSLGRIVYSSPFFLNEPQHHALFYEKSVQSGTLPEILNFIKQEIIPTLSDIRLVDDQQRFLVNDSQYSHASDLTDYGEGLQRIFFISLLFASAQNGIVLIDEFENAIHVELISQFAPFIHKLAVKFNVQLFITTHSKECIKAFVENIEKHEDFSYFTLVNNNGEIVSRYFNGTKFHRMVMRGDLDLRRIR